ERLRCWRSEPRQLFRSGRHRNPPGHDGLAQDLDVARRRRARVGSDGWLGIAPERSQPESFLLQTEHQIATAEGTLHHVADALVDDEVGALHHAGEHVPRRHVALVAVHADDPAVRLFGRLDDAEAIEARAVEDDVATAPVQVLPDLDALPFVVVAARV